MESDKEIISFSVFTVTMLGFNWAQFNAQVSSQTSVRRTVEEETIKCHREGERLYSFSGKKPMRTKGGQKDEGKHSDEIQVQ